MLDSGKRRTFSTGSVRDASEGKPCLSLLSPYALWRLGQWVTRGAEKYEARNWEKGQPYCAVADSLLRHVYKWLMARQNPDPADTDDHLAAAMCNAMFLIHYEEMMKIGQLPKDLDNRPDRIPHENLHRRKLGRSRRHGHSRGGHTKRGA